MTNKLLPLAAPQLRTPSLLPERQIKAPGAFVQHSTDSGRQLPLFRQQRIPLTTYDANRVNMVVMAASSAAVPAGEETKKTTFKFVQQTGTRTQTKKLRTTPLKAFSLSPAPTAEDVEAPSTDVAIHGEGGERKVQEEPIHVGGDTGSAAKKTDNADEGIPGRRSFPSPSASTPEDALYQPAYVPSKPKSRKRKSSDSSGHGVSDEKGPANRSRKKALVQTPTGDVSSEKISASITTMSKRKMSAQSTGDSEDKPPKKKTRTARATKASEMPPTTSHTELSASHDGVDTIVPPPKKRVQPKKKAKATPVEAPAVLKKSSPPLSRALQHKVIEVNAFRESITELTVPSKPRNVASDPYIADVPTHIFSQVVISMRHHYEIGLGYDDCMSDVEDIIIHVSGDVIRVDLSKRSLLEMNIVEKHQLEDNADMSILEAELEMWAPKQATLAQAWRNADSTQVIPPVASQVLHDDNNLPAYPVITVPVELLGTAEAAAVFTQRVLGQVMATPRVELQAQVIPRVMQETMALGLSLL